MSLAERQGSRAEPPPEPQRPPQAPAEPPPEPLPGSAAGPTGRSEVGLVLLDLHHEVVQVDELRADGQAAEGGLVEDLVEAVVVLDELGEGALQQEFQQTGATFRGGHHLQQGAAVRSRLTWMMLVPFLKLVKDLMTS